MAGPSTTTVTVDRISNGGNAIARQEIDGKTVHAPASASVGDTLEVRLTEKDGYFEATLVDRADEIHPRQPGLAPDTSEIGQDLLAPEQNESHSFEVRDSLTDDAVGQELRSWAASRKL
jgi:tRNA/tmRNA/rRNA uracil-C5-methylase (TrmA/RlmC/RlmD family)